MKAKNDSSEEIKASTSNEALYQEMFYPADLGEQDSLNSKKSKSSSIDLSQSENSLENDDDNFQDADEYSEISSPSTSVNELLSPKSKQVEENSSKEIEKEEEEPKEEE